MNVMLALAALLRGSFDEFVAGLAAAPPVDAVQEPMAVEDYLFQKRGLATWHIDLLVRHGCVSVERAGTRHVGVLWDYALHIGDRVTWDESSASFQTAYKAVPAKTYAMVAQHDADDTHLTNLRDIFAARSAVELSAFDPAETVVETLSEFIAHVRDDRRVTGPVRDILIGTHAEWGGRILFDVDVMETDAVTTYETVDAMASSLALPDDTFLPRPNPDPGRRIVFLGCDAGDAKPLLARLRQAINPATPVLAPKHWWGTMPVDGSGDLIEFLGVAHIVFSPRELSRAELIAQYQSMALRDANDAPIPSSQWDAWVPALNDVPANEPWVRSLFVEATLPAVTFGGQTIPRREHFDVRGRLGHFRHKFPVPTIRTSLSQAAFDADPTQALKDAITSLAPNPRDPFTPAHPYPWWERFRVLPPPGGTPAQLKATIERWVDLFLLLPERVVDFDGNVTITAAGITDIYVLVVPATDPAGVLYVNYYPNVPGAPQPAREDLGYGSRFWGTA